MLLALALWLANVAWAADIECPRTLASSRCDATGAGGAACTGKPGGRVNGRQVICDYAMLHDAYLGIYAEQQRRLYRGTLRKSDLQAWRRKRDACTTVRCVDEVFAAWYRMSDARPAPRQPTVADSRSNKSAPPRPPPSSAMSSAMSSAVPRAIARAGPPPEADAPGPVATPTPTATAVSLRDSLQPLPPSASRGLRQREASRASWVAWLSVPLVLLAMGGAFYWLVVRGQGSRYLDAAFAAGSNGLAWLRTLPALAFVLAGLALLNGVLLFVLLGGAGFHIPGIN